MNSVNRLSQLQNHLRIHNKMNEQIVCPKTSLEEYRLTSSIDKQMFKEHFYGQNWQYRERCFELVQKYPNIFKHHHLEEFSREEQRYHSFKAIQAFFQRLGVTFDDFKADPNIVTLTSAGMYCYDPAVCVKFGVHFHLYTKTIMNLGTDKHEQFVERAKNMQDIGSFSLTELGHGSNVRSLLTTAIYNKQKKCFIINTPHDLAMKFWIGATANLANMTVVFAQLFIDDKEYGVHAFLVEIRDKSTHTLKNGIIVGDCGPKNGNNGIDNGFLIFKNVEVPLDNMLNRFSSVSQDGVFTATIEDPDKRFAVQLGSLSGGRVMLSLYSSISGLNALTIALRYAAIRKQFGAPDENEVSILEYPLTQLRLIPSLATTLVHLNAAVKLTILWDNSQAQVFNPSSKQLAEVHAISSSLKGLTSLYSNDVILECRQLLGGHGYHQFNRLGTILADNDINTTWEGDTNILMQQTAKFLLEALNKLSKKQKLSYETLQFLTIDQTQTPFIEQKDLSIIKIDLLTQNNLQYAIEHRCTTLIQLSGLRFQKNVKNLGDMFGAWNATQPFYLQRAARAYADVYCMQEWVKANTKENQNSKVIIKIFQLWALSILEKDYGLFRDTNFISMRHGSVIKELILELCNELKSEVIGILDALAPPDEVLGSPFGRSDGDIYNTYLKQIYKSKDCFSRVPWWDQIHQQN